MLDGAQFPGSPSGNTTPGGVLFLRRPLLFSHITRFPFRRGVPVTQLLAQRPGRRAARRGPAGATFYISTAVHGSCFASESDTCAYTNTRSTDSVRAWFMRSRFPGSVSDGGIVGEVEQARPTPGRIRAGCRLGASERIRTADLRFTRALLYQLSYRGAEERPDWRTALVLYQMMRARLSGYVMLTARPSSPPR
jgi:hypothetical protein